MYTIGTAGHVDHGKSTLVQALTGINPDRWEEEQRREMTIDLGFAWLTTRAGRSVSLIDVPGHERFIKNMLAGVGGLDAVLLIVAADEGVQPQTVEHLHIIDLLGIEHGVVVLTKCDLVETEWLELMIEEVRDHLHGSVLADAPIVAVSARTGLGMADLQMALDDLLSHVPPRTSEHNTPRLPVDRVFSVGGFGTVVTGTLLDGPLHVGDELEIAPVEIRGRVRGLQTHEVKLDTALPGTRVAVNISGVERTAVQRGAVLTLPGTLRPTDLLDVHLRLTDDAPVLHHNDALDLFVGTAEVACHAALLDRETLHPGATGWVQLRLAQPIAVQRGDRCIVRRPSPSQTIGGGVIVDVHPARHRRFRAAVVEHLETLARGTPEDLLLHAIADAPAEWRDVVARLGLAEDVAREALELACNNGTLLIVQDAATTIGPATIIISQHGWDVLLTTITGLIRDYHARWPLRRGIPREELRSRLRLGGRAFNAVLERAVATGQVGLTENAAHRPAFMPQPTIVQQQQIEATLARWHTAPTTPPTRATLDLLDAEVVAWILEHEQLIALNTEVLLLPQTYAAMRAWVDAQFAADQPITLAAFRDTWQTTRRYAQAFLEHLDDQHITRRVGDVRVRW